MTSELFNSIVTQAHARRDALLESKGREYTRESADRLANFKRIAEALGLTPLQIWAVYFHKHIDAIMTFVKSGKPDSEGIEGRIDDASNYLDLLLGLIEDLKEPLQTFDDRTCALHEGPCKDEKPHSPVYPGSPVRKEESPSIFPVYDKYFNRVSGGTHS